MSQTYVEENDYHALILKQYPTMKGVGHVIPRTGTEYPDFSLFAANRTLQPQFLERISAGCGVCRDVALFFWVLYWNGKVDLVWLPATPRSRPWRCKNYVWYLMPKNRNGSNKHLSNSNKYVPKILKLPRKQTANDSKPTHLANPWRKNDRKPLINTPNIAQLASPLQPAHLRAQWRWKEQSGKNASEMAGMSKPRYGSNLCM